MMFRKFVTISGKEIWLNIDKVEAIQDYHAVRRTDDNDDEKYSMIFICTEHHDKAYVVKGSAEEIVSGIYNSKWRWDGHG